MCDNEVDDDDDRSSNNSNDIDDMKEDMNSLHLGTNMQMMVKFLARAQASRLL